MQIKYFVRTTNERQIHASYDQVDYVKLIDLEHKPVMSFINQLISISDYDAVLLEDDLLLCRNFKERLEDVVSNYSNDIINFFTKPNIFFTTRRSSCFCYNQCTFYPKGIAKKIATEMLRLLQFDSMYKDCKQYDILENAALRNLKLKHIQYRPCLVQHLDFGSIMNNNVSYSRRCVYFIDYLDDLNINYKTSYKQYTNLAQYMDSQFKEMLDNGKKD